ncbi:MAG: hypothetical protein ABFD18_20540 [Syntrophomonas sp.]
MYQIGDVDLIDELVAHPVFGTGRVIRQDGSRITIQFSEETGEKRFIYPDAFAKHLNMCNSSVAQSVLADLLAKTELIEEQQRKEEECTRKAMENLEIIAQKRKQQQKGEEAVLAHAAKKKKGVSKAKPPKTMAQMLQTQKNITR